MTHLILKDMVKVKGQVSEMAVLLIDPVPQIAALAKNFFNELSHKVRGSRRPLPREQARTHRHTPCVDNMTLSLTGQCDL